MDSSIYRNRPNLMIGFHGCDEKVRDALVTKPNKIKESNASYDWLGHGFYVWENNYERALQWAKDKKKRDGKDDYIPSVVGVVFVLGNCLDFTDYEYTKMMGDVYRLFKEHCNAIGKTLPINREAPGDNNHDLLLRDLDCAVIEFFHEMINSQSSKKSSESYSGLMKFDSTRGLFLEGSPVYDGAGIRLKNHIQICIRNKNCIKGFFIPREATY